VSNRHTPTGDYNNEQRSSLLMTKTRIAPLKLRLVPQLELCGALLAAQLLSRVAEGIDIPSDCQFAWSDAKVAWIRGYPLKWTAFVANRMAAVQELLPEERWYYVPMCMKTLQISQPDVCRSTTSEIASCDGVVHRLESVRKAWPREKIAWDELDIPEKRRSVFATTNAVAMNDVLLRFSFMERLDRVTAYCLRWLPGARKEGLD